jgi:hypothetical protein
MMRFFSAASCLAATAMVSALDWQDCNLQSERPDLRVSMYNHFPDPEVSTMNHSIVKAFKFTGLEAIDNMKENVIVERSEYSPIDPLFKGWEAYFNNTFEICDNHDVCPVQPNTEFTLVDNHAPSNSEGAWFRATEHYFTGSDDTWIGCLTTIYQTVN